MNWTKAKSALATIAPFLAGTLGSPVAGIAVKTLVDVLGLSEDQATPENVITALSGASPEQLNALREAEFKHAEFMASIGYKNIEQLEALTVNDRDSARRRESEVKDNTPKVLAALSVLAFVGLILYVAIGNAPDQTMRDGFWMLAGAVIATYKDVYGYYFGSSHGSKTKDSTINEAMRK